MLKKTLSKDAGVKQAMSDAMQKNGYLKGLESGSHVEKLGMGRNPISQSIQNVR